MNLITKRVLKPGTKKLIAKYGNKLLCVRYEYDETAHKEIKTVKIIEEESNYIPNKNKIVKIKIDYNEIELRRKVKKDAGKLVIKVLQT